MSFYDPAILSHTSLRREKGTQSAMLIDMAKVATKQEVREKVSSGKNQQYLEMMFKNLDRRIAADRQKK